PPHMRRRRRRPDDQQPGELVPDGMKAHLEYDAPRHVDAPRLLVGAMGPRVQIGERMARRELGAPGAGCGPEPGELRELFVLGHGVRVRRASRNASATFSAPRSCASPRLVITATTTPSSG